MEYAILGLITAAIAAVVGSIAAYVIITKLMGAAWIWLPLTVAQTAILSVAVTIALGLFGTWAALAERPAPHLRNDRSNRWDEASWLYLSKAAKSSSVGDY